MKTKSLTDLMLIPLIAVLVLATFALVGAAEDPNENWCYAGGPWGDGRCSHSDPAIAEWYWTCGWYRAQIIKGTFGVNDVPQTCQAPRREIFIELGGGGGGGGSYDATFNGNIDYCQWNAEAGGVQGNLTRFQVTVSNYVGTNSNINDVIRVRITANEFTFEEYITSGAAANPMTFTVPADYTSITGGLLALFAGNGEQLGAANLNNINCDQAPPIP